MTNNTTNTPAVTVIVPVYNAEISLEKCIKSILDLDYPKDRLEIIFIDNNSTDASLSILEKYKDRIKVLNEKKQGAPAARNKGIKEASHEIIAFADADCEVDKEWLKKLVEVLAKNQNISAVGGKILSKKPCNDIERYGEIIHDNEKAINFYDPPYIASGNMAIKKSLIIKVGMFDEEIVRSEDLDMFFRLNSIGYRFKYTPEAVVFHQNEKTLMGLLREGFVHGLWSVKVIKKHKDGEFKHRKKVFWKNLPQMTKMFFLLITKGLSLKEKDIFLLCGTIYDLGKKIGIIWGVIRFGFVI